MLVAEASKVGVGQPARFANESFSRKTVLSKFTGLRLREPWTARTIHHLLGVHLSQFEPMFEFLALVRKRLDSYSSTIGVVPLISAPASELRKIDFQRILKAPDEVRDRLVSACIPKSGVPRIELLRLPTLYMAAAEKRDL